MTLLLDVGDPLRNVVLNLTFLGIAVVTLISLIPWRLRGDRTRWTRYLPLWAIGLYVVYEVAMPPNWDIRLDLFLLAPMGLLIFLAWGVRVILWRRRANGPTVGRL